MVRILTNRQTTRWNTTLSSSLSNQSGNLSGSRLYHQNHWLGRVEQDHVLSYFGVNLVHQKHYLCSQDAGQNKKHPQRFGFHLWLTEITVRWHFDALPQSEPKNPDTQDSSLDSLEELMRGNVDITVPSMIQNPRLLSWCCCTCFWSGFSKTANT